MKKRIVFLFFIFLFVGCEEPTIENSIKNPQEETNYRIQELPKDTIIVINDPETDLIYVFNEETNLIEYKMSITNNYELRILFGWFLGFLFIAFLFGILTILSIISMAQTFNN